MRQIKFRGKRIDNSEWIYGFIWQKLNPHKKENEYLDKVFMQTGVNIDVWHEVHPDTVGQFTGIHDNNRNEICEGDVLNFYELDELVDVFYDEGAFWVLFDSNNEKELLTQKLTDANYVEIEGNIHDNPELT